LPSLLLTIFIGQELAKCPFIVFRSSKL